MSLPRRRGTPRRSQSGGGGAQSDDGLDEWGKSAQDRVRASCSPDKHLRKQAVVAQHAHVQQYTGESTHMKSSHSKLSCRSMPCLRFAAP
jgi:hypothetical protein